MLPRIAPDGSTLAFRTSITGAPQMWTTPASGWPEQHTFGQPITFHAYSPTGEWIAYGTDRSGNEREGFYLISPDGRRERELLAPSRPPLPPRRRLPRARARRRVSSAVGNQRSRPARLRHPR